MIRHALVASLVAFVALSGCSARSAPAEIAPAYQVNSDAIGKWCVDSDAPGDAEACTGFAMATAASLSLHHAREGKHWPCGVAPKAVHAATAVRDYVRGNRAAADGADNATRVVEVALYAAYGSACR